MEQQNSTWLASYIENLGQTNKSIKTIDNYQADLKRYIHWYEKYCGKKINQANGETITLYKHFLKDGENKLPAPKKKSSKFVSLLKKAFFNTHNKKNQNIINNNPLGISSRRRHLSSIKNFYQFLKESNEDHNKYFKNNPVKSKLHSIKVKDSDIIFTKLLTLEDWQKIDSIIWRPKECLIVQILYFGGLRLQELTHLKLEAFNRDDHTITFLRKGGYRHTLYIQNPDKIFQSLDRFLAKKNHFNEFLFSNKKGRRISPRSMHNTVVNILKKCGLEERGLTPHSFRKACATNLYHQTHDLLLVRDYLNHSDAKVTQTYISNLDSSHRSRIYQ